METTGNYSVLTENSTHDTPVWHNWYEYGDAFDDWSFRSAQTAIEYVACVALPIFILFGGSSNIMAFVVLIRQRQLQHQHEGCLYLAAIFVTDIGILIGYHFNSWFHHMHFRSPLNHGGFSLFICRVWHYFSACIFDILGFMTIALLFGVYLREHLVRRRRCGCPNFAKKYCTVLVSIIIISCVVGINLVINLPYLWWVQLHEYGVETWCAFNHDVLYLYTQSFLMWILPSVFILPVILLMVLCTKSGEGDFQFLQIDERSTAQTEVRKVAVLISSISFLLNFFMIATNIASLIIYHTAFTEVNVLLHVFHCLSLGIYPILSIVLISEFRKEAQSIGQRMNNCFRGCCPDIFRRFEQDESEYNVLHMNAIEDDLPAPTDR